MAVSKKALQLAQALVSKSQRRDELISARLQSNPATLAAAKFNLAQAEKRVRFLRAES